MENNFVPFGVNIRVKFDEKKFLARPAEGVFLDVGEVMAVGDEVKKIKVGDRVSCWLFGIKEVMHGEEKHCIVPENDKFVLEICPKI